jgi:hypothetical protein
MASIVTELQGRVDHLERGLRRQHFASDLHARIDRLERLLHGRHYAGGLQDQFEQLEHRLGGWGPARRQAPPVAGFEGGLILGALAGGMLGAALALLFARQTGWETREQLHEAAGELRAEGLALREQARNMLDTARAEVAARRTSGPVVTGAALARGAPEGTDERVGGTA